MRTKIRAQSGHIENNYGHFKVQKIGGKKGTEWLFVWQSCMNSSYTICMAVSCDTNKQASSINYASGNYMSLLVCKLFNSVNVYSTLVHLSLE